MSRPRLTPARLGPADVLRVGGAGLRARPLRVFLSALGIAIGIAAMISVVGISTSSREELNRTLEALGTNLLTVAPGQSFFGDESHLPDEAIAMIGRIGPVTSVTAIGMVRDTRVYRTDKIPAGQSGGIGVYATRLDLLGTVGASLASGTWLNDATAQYPAVVLGSRALGLRSRLQRPCLFAQRRQRQCALLQSEATLRRGHAVPGAALHPGHRISAGAQPG